MIVSVIAGGWSLRGLQLHNAPGHVIGVNEVGVLLDVDSIVSMDRLWTENRWDQLCRLRKQTWLRRNCLINISDRPDWLNIYENQRITEMSELGLNGTNSGMVAINLAWIMKPKKIYLFGFDMCRSPGGEAYWYKPYPWSPKGGTKAGKYAEWAGEFADAANKFSASGIEVINASLVSKLRVFPQQDPAEILA